MRSSFDFVSFVPFVVIQRDKTTTRRDFGARASRLHT